MDDAGSSKVRISGLDPESSDRDLGTTENQESRPARTIRINEKSHYEVYAICLIFVVFEENNLVALICKIYIDP